MHKAFTFIEILIVIAILGSLATIVMFNFKGPQERARDSKRQSEIQQYQNLLELYANNNNNRFINSSGSVVANTLCGSSGLNSSSCPDDQHDTRHYMYNGTTSEYVLWTHLEVLEAGSENYFVICSNGVSGFSTTEPSSSTCPL